MKKIFLVFILVLLAAGVILLAAGLLKKNYGANQLKDAAVIAAARDIPSGKVFAPGDLTVKKVTLSEPNAILDTGNKVADITGAYAAKINILKGNQVTSDMISKASVTGVLNQGDRGYIWPDSKVPGISVFLADGHYYSVLAVSPEEAQKMLMKEVKETQKK